VKNVIRGRSELKKADLLPGDLIYVRIKKRFVRRDDYNDTHGPFVYQGELPPSYEEPGIRVNHRAWKESKFVWWRQMQSLRVHERMPVAAAD